MIGSIWAALKFLLELWEALKVFLGIVEKQKHEADVKEINEKTEEAGNIAAPEEERHEATKDLEDMLNKHT